MEHEFIDWGFTSDKARELYKRFVIPLRNEFGRVDGHTHFSLKELLQNNHFPDLLTALVINQDPDPKIANQDHYFAQLVAGEGVPFEFLYDRDIPKIEKWKRICKVYPQLALSQVDDWTELELGGLGITDEINEANAVSIWEQAEKALRSDAFKPQALLQNGDAAIISTTDDPIDDLYMPEEIAGMMRLNPLKRKFQVIPTFRPDKYVNIFSPTWRANVMALLEKQRKNGRLDGLEEAIADRHAYFVSRGCRATDHALEVPYGYDVSDRRKDVEEVFRQAFEMGTRFESNSMEARLFISHMMHFIVGLNKEADDNKGIVTNLHIAARRNENKFLFANWKADVGGDLAAENVPLMEPLSDLLNRYCATGDRDKDAKVILYSLNPNHYPVIAQMGRVFPGIRWGPAWWYNDNIYGMMHQFRTISPVLPFSRFSGMVCDGRKLLSFMYRHVMSDVALCNVVGERMLMNPRMTFAKAERVLKGACYQNQVDTFRYRLAA